MTHNINFFELTSDYLMGNLSEIEKSSFENEMISNIKLQQQVMLEKEIFEALSEKDILELRAKLQTAADHFQNRERSFQLLESIDNLEPLKENIPTEELLNQYESLPKAHIYQHELTRKEFVHEFYNEQKVHETIEEDTDNSIFSDDTLHEDLKEAVLELDIIELREKIKLVSKENPILNHKSSHIEEYIDGELTGEELLSLEEEINHNKDLKSEIDLRQSVNNAIIEDDIMLLKEKLNSLKKDMKRAKLSSIIPPSKRVKSYIWKSAVASVVAIFFISTLFNSSQHIYNKFFDPPRWAPQRTVSNEIDFIQQGNIHYMQGEYEEAVAYYNHVDNISTESEFIAHFYKGASLQNLNRFNEAIIEYSAVIKHGDNMFIEEAEWYSALCHLKLNERKIAKQNLLAIIEKRGFYAKKAKAILRRMRSI